MRILADNIAAPGFSPKVLLTLLSVLMVSVVVFYWQVRRWTTNRAWLALWDWARANGFNLNTSEAPAPSPLDSLKNPPTMSTSLTGKQTVLASLRGATPADGAPPVWHVLIRQIESNWKPTGLRPAQAPSSLLDLFSLSSFPGMGEIERFVIYGTESREAQQLSQSTARGLLPPDVGMLLHGRHLVLDFSSRPLDPIEFGRMIGLAEQLVTHLPPA